ncbi:MAG: imelysin family protein [Alphaproteobacteria bacterium]|nr:imelysin family protein [Alphaproteobacteria bacterium]
MKTTFLSVVAAVAALTTGSLAAHATASAAAPAKDAILATYADIAQAGYEDSVTLAKELKTAVDALVANPSEETMTAARDAWVASRVPYMQTEVYRFGNPIVDDWEGKVNAWPLDEGLIDYVDASYGTDSEDNAAYVANVIANPALTIGSDTVDASSINADLLADTLHEVGGVEANVATGYHAVEFLLWGQDLNGTDAGAGERPWTDYASGDDCTNGNCDRRAEYLTTSTNLLIADLEWIAGQWGPEGDARADLVSDGVDGGIARILTGMGSLSYGELAGERMQLGLLLHDPEEEHDCFADNTHNSHYYDAQGVLNAYTGSYTRIDGTKVEGASVSALVAAKDKAADAALLASLDTTMGAMGVMKERALGGEAYDQMIGEGNTEGNAVVQAAIDGLTAQTKGIEAAVTVLGLEPIAFEGSDSLDSPEAVFE